MKQLTCEMCGGTDLIKDGGVFTCQTCGCKYSVEEAKKMMIEGTVDVQGTVKVDNSEFVEKYLANARRAKEKEDWEETEKYYNLVEQNDPDNIEAIFYSAYAKAKVSLTDQDIHKRGATFKVLRNCVSVVDDHYKIERRDENKKVITDMASDLAKMICGSFVYTEWKNKYGMVLRTNEIETVNMFGGLLDEFRETINNIQQKDDQPYMHIVAAGLYQRAKATGRWKEGIFDGWIVAESKKLKKSVEAYWEEHASEKKDLESEKTKLQSQISELNKQIENLQEHKAVQDIEEKISYYNEKLAGLSLFKRKELKETQTVINDLKEKLEGAEKDLENAARPYKASIQQKQQRVDAIDKTLKIGI